MSKPAGNVIDLTEDSQDVSSGAESLAGRYWLRNALYTLTSTNKVEVLSHSGWLSDSVISAVQLLILQEFPHIWVAKPHIPGEHVLSSAQGRACALETVTGVLFPMSDVVKNW